MQSTTGLIGRAIGLMRRRFPVLVGLAFWPYLTLVVFFAMIGVALRLLRPAGAPPTDPIETWRSMTVLAKLGVVLSFIAWTSFPWGLGTAGISLLVWHDCRGQEVSLGSVLVRLMRRLPSLLLLSFVLGGVAMFGLGILVLPGLIFFVASAFAVDVMTNEEAGVVRALERSISLVGDRSGQFLPWPWLWVSLQASWGPSFLRSGLR